MQPSLTLGGVDISTYLLALTLGATLAVTLGYKALRRNGRCSPLWAASTLVLVYVAAFVGARVFFVVEYVLAGDGSSAGEHLISGGVVSHGAFFFAFAALWASCILSRTPFVHSLDTLAPAICVVGALGRLGCFLAGCCYGRPTKVLHAVVFPAGSPAARHLGESVPVHPTQLYEVVAYLLALALVLRWSRGRFAALVVVYSTTRFAVEFFRGDTVVSYAGLGLSQWYCLVMLVLVCAWVTAGLKERAFTQNENVIMGI